MKGKTVKEPDAALAAARRFQRHREAIAQSLDELAAAYAEMYVSWVRCARAQQTQLVEAGHADLAVNVGPVLAHVEAALACALDEVERWPDMRIPGAFAWRDHIMPSQRKPLADVDGCPDLLVSEGTT